MRRKMRRKIIYALLLSITITCSMGFALFATEFGARWLVRHALPVVFENKLQIQAVQGTLLSPLRLAGITYQPAPSMGNPTNKPTTIDNVSLEWRPGALLSGLAHIHRLRISGIRYGIPKDDGHPESEPISMLPLPPALRIERLEVTDLHIDGDEHVDIERITGALAFAGGKAPLIIEPFQVISGATELTLAMEIEPVAPFAYKARGQGRTTLPDGTALAGEISLHGDASKAVLERFSVEVAKGHIAGQGWVDWSPGIQWDLGLSARGMDPNIYWSLLQPERKNRWRGALNMVLRSQGRRDDDGLDLALDIERLDGILRGYPIAGSGRLTLAGRRLEARGLELRSGDNRLKMHGATLIPSALFRRLTGSTTVDASGDSAPDSTGLSFEIDAPMLKALWPDLDGRLQGEGRLAGSLFDPEISLRMTGKALAYRAHRIAALRAKLALHPAAASRADIEVEDVLLANHEFPRIRAQGTGRLALEQITLGMDFSCASDTDWGKFLCPEDLDPATRARGGRLALQLDGRLKDSAWSGRLKRAHMDLLSLGDWQLARPIPLLLGADMVRLGASTRNPRGRRHENDQRACWQWEGARICTRGAWSKGSGSYLKGDMVGLPWQVLRPWLPASLEIRGAIAGDFDLSRARDAEARLTITPGTGALIYRRPNRRPLETTFRDARLTASYAKNSLQADVKCKVAEQGFMKGKLRIDMAGNQYPLQGTLQGKLPDLALLSGSIPQTEKIEGALTLAFTAEGSLKKPILRGRGTLAGGAVDLLAPGIHLRDIAMEAEARGSRPLKIKGEIRSGPGRLIFTGEIREPFGVSPRFELSARGDDFQVLQLPEAEVLASPNLRVVSDRKGVFVDGEIAIPEARIKIDALSETGVAVSEDEVIVGEEGIDASEGKPAHAVHAKVSVMLGDRVTFEGFGIKAGLTGSVAIESHPEKPPMGNGSIVLRDGQYRAYGQSLVIEHGRLVFSGPMDNPALDARATRKVADGKVTVGIDITGALKQSRMSLSSEPIMPESEILAYLLTGKSLANASHTDQAALLDTAIGLAFTESKPLASQLGRKIGIDTVKIRNEGNTLQESALLLGKYLTPKLYVGYVQGLFENTRTFEAEYHITNALSIKARSGTAQQGAEVLYSIERE
uniref:Translocation and assembly module TamB n=1 Tax=Candidatus Kentrum sp. UNK TaxID=2126344 RepID=A0A451AX12_9GAMM|nr:MAG: translocation and assembly module TamB [Candidatus Kentron sp. UNK]VFK70568.1 MAG: translocation and assembly module TamB [Candidatus Kentron sp. UNK]